MASAPASVPVAASAAPAVESVTLQLPPGCIESIAGSTEALQKRLTAEHESRLRAALIAKTRTMSIAQLQALIK